MGKASKWFRSLFGLKKPNNVTMTTPTTDAKSTPSRRWSFSRSTSKRCYHITSPSIVPALPQFQLKGDDDQQHAIVAAEARRVGCGNMNELKGNVKTTVFVRNSCYGNREYWVAVKIQSHFRAYLARKALRALKGLVKLQALVRGHIVRKQIAERLLQMQAALRARTRARALRSQIYESSQSANKLSHLNYPGPATPENYEHDIHESRISKHEQSVLLEERSGSISNFGVELDKEKSSFHYSTDEGSYGRVNRDSHSFTTSKDSIHHQAIFSTSSGEDQSPSLLKFTNDVDEASFAAETSLQFISTKTASFTRTGPYTPTRSNLSKSCHSGYSDYCPSYMSYTESSKAKLRSFSSPRQKTQLERSNTVKRFPIYGGYGNMKSSSTTLHSNFISKAYPGSGRLDRLGMPLGSKGVGFSGGLVSSY